MNRHAHGWWCLSYDDFKRMDSTTVYAYVVYAEQESPYYDD